MTKLTNFGKMLAKTRIDLDESQMTMAKKLGYTKANLNLFETGKKTIPVDFVERFAKAYPDAEDNFLSLLENKVMLETGTYTFNTDSMLMREFLGTLKKYQEDIHDFMIVDMLNVLETGIRDIEDRRI